MDGQCTAVCADNLYKTYIIHAHGHYNGEEVQVYFHTRKKQLTNKKTARMIIAIRNQR